MVRMKEVLLGPSKNQNLHRAAMYHNICLRGQRRISLWERWAKVRPFLSFVMSQPSKTVLKCSKKAPFSQNNQKRFGEFFLKVSDHVVNKKAYVFFTQADWKRWPFFTKRESLDSPDSSAYFWHDSYTKAKILSKRHQREMSLAVYGATFFYRLFGVTKTTRCINIEGYCPVLDQILSILPKKGFRYF